MAISDDRLLHADWPRLQQLLEVSGKLASKLKLPIVKKANIFSPTSSQFVVIMYQIQVIFCCLRYLNVS